MGLFGFLGGSSAGAFKKHAARVANKRAYGPDRWESIHTLGKMKTPEAVEALLARFDFLSDPTITDEEEKDAVLRLVVEADAVAEAPVRAYLARAESIGWPLKILEKILEPSEVVGALLELLAGMDTEYERDPEKKIQVVSYLSDRKDPRIALAVLRFLEDMNETVRFQTVAALLAQDLATAQGCGESDVRDKLVGVLVGEESVRVRAAIADGFVARAWNVLSRAADVRPKLPEKYALDTKGLIRRG